VGYALKNPAFGSIRGMSIKVAEKYKGMFIEEFLFPRTLPFHQSSIPCCSSQPCLSSDPQLKQSSSAEDWGICCIHICCSGWQKHTAPAPAKGGYVRI